MKDTCTDDPFLEKRIVKYDEWLANGTISFSSKVIPISESLKMKQWVLPTEQAMEILRNAKSLAVQNCASIVENALTDVSSVHGYFEMEKCNTVPRHVSDAGFASPNALPRPHRCDY